MTRASIAEDDDPLVYGDPLWIVLVLHCYHSKVWPYAFKDRSLGPLTQAFALNIQQQHNFMGQGLGPSSLLLYILVGCYWHLDDSSMPYLTLDSCPTVECQFKIASRAAWLISRNLSGPSFTPP